jgi:hypothetical protein
MRYKLPGQVLGHVMVLTIGLGFSGVGLAQPKSKNKSSEAGGDKAIEKQSAWEQGVMGEDSAKKSDLRKIAAAQKLADETRKNPPPIAAPKIKDPSKEGVRAKQEANIGLPIASDEAANTKASRKGSAGSGNATGRKAAPPTSSANDELGSLVASSLAEDKVSQSGRTRSGGASDAPAARALTNEGRANRTKGGARHHAKGKARAKSGEETVAGRGSPGALDQLFAAGK